VTPWPRVGGGSGEQGTTSPARRPPPAKGGIRKLRVSASELDVIIGSALGPCFQVTLKAGDTEPSGKTKACVEFVAQTIGFSIVDCRK
jgi:hypothetical protein